MRTLSECAGLQSITLKLPLRRATVCPRWVAVEQIGIADALTFGVLIVVPNIPDLDA